MTLTAADANDVTDTGYDETGKSYTFKDSGTNDLSTHTSPGGDSPTIPDSATVIAAFGGDGVAALDTFKLVKSEVLGTITVSDGSLSGTSNSVTVSPAATSQFEVVPSTSTPSTADTISITVTAKDAYMNTNTAYTGDFYMITNATAPIWYTDSGRIETSGTKTVSNCLKFQTVESDKTITANSYTGGLSGTSASITVTTAVEGVGTLSIDGKPEIIKSVAHATGEWSGGWIFNIKATVPTNIEHGIKMIFNNWKQSGATAIPVANNIRFSVGGGTPVTITEAANANWDNWLPEDWLDISGVSDADSLRDGKQITIKVETKIPDTVTLGGSYSAAFALDAQ